MPLNERLGQAGALVKFIVFLIVAALIYATVMAIRALWDWFRLATGGSWFFLILAVVCLIVGILMLMSFRKHSHGHGQWISQPKGTHDADSLHYMSLACAGLLLFLVALWVAHINGLPLFPWGWTWRPWLAIFVIVLVIAALSGVEGISTLKTVMVLGTVLLVLAAIAAAHQVYQHPFVAAAERASASIEPGEVDCLRQEGVVRSNARDDENVSDRYSSAALEEARQVYFSGGCRAGNAMTATKVEQVGRTRQVRITPVVASTGTSDPSDPVTYYLDIKDDALGSSPDPIYRDYGVILPSFTYTVSDTAWEAGRLTVDSWATGMLARLPGKAVPATIELKRPRR